MHPYLLLKSKDMANATIDRILNPSKSLITKSNHGVEAFVRRNSEKHFGSIAGSEHLVHGGEVSGALVRVKIWCKNATLYTLPSKELAGTTRSTTTPILTTTHH